VKLNDLRPAKGSVQERRRIARGNAGRAGKYGGRGRKGQGSRSGGGKAPYFEGGQLPFVRRLPYRRGFTNIFRVHYTAVNIGRLEELFDPQAEVTPETLVAAGVLRSVDEPYKILGDGELETAFVVQAPRFSESARQRIEAAGGTCVYLDDTYRRAGMGRRRRR
jgi:large subunit ribosomal protein L15